MANKPLIVASWLGAGTFIAGAAAFAVRRSGTSIRARLMNALVPLVAPKLEGEGALARAIAEDRERGPAKPSKRLLKRFEFRDELRGEDRLFHLSSKQPDTGLRFLYLHGGAYVLDFNPVQWALPAGLLDRLGGKVVAPIYPLAPEQTWTDTLQSVQRVYLDLVRESGAENIVVFGDSAGGGLALGLCQRMRDQGLPLPNSLILFSPFLDLGVSGDDQPALEARDPALNISFLRAAGRSWAGDLQPNDARVSPLYGDHHDLPPILVFSGTRDVLDSDSLRLAAMAPAVVHSHVRNMIHVWPCAPIPEARQALDLAAKFINTHNQSRTA